MAVSDIKLIKGFIRIYIQQNIAIAMLIINECLY